jgi:NADH:ubiquinone oxidoreductase subunit C
MKSAQIKTLIEKNVPWAIVEVSRERRIMVYIPFENLLATLQFLCDQGVTHVSTITGVDRIQDNKFELLYHLYWEQNEITVRFEVDRNKPIVPTVSTLLPGAVVYEREIQDMFGICVTDIPDRRRLLLFDEWPEGEYPLRKDYQVKMNVTDIRRI